MVALSACLYPRQIYFGKGEKLMPCVTKNFLSESLTWVKKIPGNLSLSFKVICVPVSDSLELHFPESSSATWNKYPQECNIYYLSTVGKIWRSELKKMNEESTVEKSKNINRIWWTKSMDRMNHVVFWYQQKVRLYVCVFQHKSTAILKSNHVNLLLKNKKNRIQLLDNHEN